MKAGTGIMKRCLAIMLVFVLSIAMLPEADSSAKKATATVSMKGKDVTFYFSGTNDVSTQKVYYNGKGDIPYYDMDAAWTGVEKMMKVFNPNGVTVTVKKSGNKVVWERNNNNVYSTVTFDFKKNTIVFSDVNAFFRRENASLVSIEYGPNMETLFQAGDNNYNRYGSSITCKLNNYGVKLLKTKKKYYIPIQTLSDLLYSRLGVYTVFNGESIILSGSSILPDDLKTIYHSVAPKKMSKAYSDFNYGELCLAMDYLFGPKESHDIKTFDEFFSETGLKAMIKTQQAEGTDVALITAINMFFDDLHCAYGTYSCNSSRDFIMEQYQKLPLGAYRTRASAVKEVQMAAREKYYPNGVPAYCEEGDTAYITFDEFAIDMTQNHDVLPTDADLPKLGGDTVRLMQYSLARITRDKSPIKRVVLDLSTNSGGLVYTGCYLLATFLGNSSVALKDVTTGAISMVNYKADVNLDKVFDEKDTLAGRGLKFYCLTSGYSYSCANMVPCMFKDSGKVTLIGRTSGGGSCAVQPLSTASGTAFQISGPYQFSFSKNGALYDCDRGAEPDYYLEDMSKMYDRKYMNSFMDKIE